MGEQEGKEGFEATEYDEKGNIKLPPPPVVAAKAKRPTVAGLKKELDELKADIDNDILGWLGELAIRLEKTEEGTAKHNEALLSDVKMRLDILDQAVMRLSDALPTIGTAIAELQQPPETEIEFAQPPQPTAGGQVWGSDIEAVASTCLTMNDVLMICRALKDAPEIPDKDKTQILNTACRSSGVILTPGLQIRAGVKFTGA